MVEFDRAAFIGKFQEEATDLLQRLNEGVITLEGDPSNRELIDQMLRDAHTLKGSSRMVGLLEISDIAHRLEDIMVQVRDGQRAYVRELSDPFFEALDTIVFLAENAGKEGIEVDVDALLNQLSGIRAECEPEDPEDPEDAAQASRAAAPVKVVRRVTAEAIAEDAAAADESQADEQRADEQHVEIHGGAHTGRSDELKSRAQTTVRVRTAQVDLLLNLVSEVVISQIKAEQRALDLRGLAAELADVWQAWVRVKSAISATGDHALLEAVGEELDVLDGLLAEHRRRAVTFSKDFVDDASRTSAVVAELQEQGMRLRMLPVSTVFNAFPRAVRDLAKEFRKEVDFAVEGGETELDKKVLEEINDPLVHIMRNAIDHGIERPEVREAAGKPRTGTIRMVARQEGDHIVIEISDDGAGIDPENVRAAAIRKGFLTENEARSMSDREATYLIFEPGFTTSPIITEISGRGVGMDVVREFIVDKLKGTLDVETAVGKGTTFKLTIPLTLAIIRALMLNVSGQTFALPTGSIEETLRVDSSEVIKVEGREVIRRQRRNVPLVRLGDVLGVSGNGSGSAKIPIAVVGFSGHRMGFMVDEFVGEQQIVIKNLGSHLRKVDNVAGVTVLGAGEIVPILNVPDLMHNARTRTGYRSRQAVVAEAAAERTGPKRILICEDSFTTRELERSIFEAAGYSVEVAMDGAMGLGKLREGLDVDAVVTDVQMPNMTGFELTKAIKTDPSLANIPVVIVTSLERDEEKAQGIDAGADAYITKSVFNQDTLLDTVERLIL